MWALRNLPADDGRTGAAGSGRIGGICIKTTFPGAMPTAGLTIWQWMTESGKPFKDLYNEVINITHPCHERQY
jgi:hypothetical protein